MAHDEQVWYQAKLWLWSSDGPRDGSRRIPLGPPRRLIADVAIDIARKTQEIAGYENQYRMIAGAEIIWPPEQAGEWLREDKLKAMQDA